MPKRIDLDDEMPRARRGARAAAIEEPTQRNLAIRILLYSPKDFVAGVIAFAAVTAILANAMLMQSGRHPAPMFGAAVNVINPLPRPRPAEATLRTVDIKLTDPRPMDGRAAAPASVPAKSNPAPTVPANAAKPPPPISVSSRSDPLGDLIVASRRVAAVQRALTDYGYGQLKPTGTVGSDTSAAIQKFERDRKLPVTGHVSDRLVRELSTVTGRAID